MHLGELIALGSLSTFPQLHQVLHQLLFPFLIQQNNTNQSALLYFKHPQCSFITCNRKSSIQMFHQLGSSCSMTGLARPHKRPSSRQLMTELPHSPPQVRVSAVRFKNQISPSCGSWKLLGFVCLLMVMGLEG